jgi:hypothetical protein
MPPRLYGPIVTVTRGVMSVCNLTVLYQNTPDWINLTQSIGVSFKWPAACPGVSIPMAGSEQVAQGTRPLITVDSSILGCSGLQ